MKSQIIQELKKHAKQIKTIEGLVSVVFPFYGNFDIARALIAIESIKYQRDVELEAVVAEENDRPKLQERLIPLGVKYVFRPVRSLVEGKFFRPSSVRNLATRNSCGEFLYNNDADIVFWNPFYLKELTELLKSEPELILYRPPMRRLPIECFEEFKARVEANGVMKAVFSIDMSQPYIATTRNKKIKIKVFKKLESGREKIFLFTEEDHKKYLSDPSFKGQEPLFSTLDVHSGGIFMRRNHFDLVGGYSESFAAWGCHDADMQWKLRECFNLQKIPYEQRFEVLHFDHPRDYFSKGRWLKNRKYQQLRRVRGILDCAIEDIEILNKYNKGKNE